MLLHVSSDLICGLEIVEFRVNRRFELIFSLISEFWGPENKRMLRLAIHGGIIAFVRSFSFDNTCRRSVP